MLSPGQGSHCNHEVTAAADVCTESAKNAPRTARHGWERGSQDPPFTAELLLLIESGKIGVIAFSVNSYERSQSSGHTDGSG